MTAELRAFLNSVRYARAECNRISAKVTELEAQATNITPRLTGMPRSGNADAQARWACIADETDRLYKQLQYYFDQIHKVEEFIDRIPDDRHREVLKLRYIDCLKWAQVSQRLSYEYRHVLRLHGEALEAARRLWAQDNKEEKS